MHNTMHNTVHNTVHTNFESEPESCAGLGWAVVCVMAPVASRKMECLAPFLLVVNFPFNTAMQCNQGNAMRSVSPFPSLPRVSFSSRFRRGLVAFFRLVPRIVS